MKINLGITAVLGFLAIVLGAFGAHTLKSKVGLEQLKVFETGVRYQMYHVLVLLFVNTYADFSQEIKNRISILFFIGIIFFSGSLYCLSTGMIASKFIGPVTPLGGLFFILGWLVMAYQFFKKIKHPGKRY